MGCRGHWETFFLIHILNMKLGKYNGGIELVMDVLGHLFFFLINIHHIKAQQGSGDIRVASLLFADVVVLLVLLDFDLWCTMKQIAAQCDAVKMKIITFKSDRMLLSP